MTGVDQAKVQLKWYQPLLFKATASGFFRADLIMVFVEKLLTDYVLSSHPLISNPIITQVAPL